LSPPQTADEKLDILIQQHQLLMGIITHLLQNQKTLMDLVETTLKDKDRTVETATDADRKEKKRSLVISDPLESTAPKISDWNRKDHQKIIAMVDSLNVEAVPTQVYRLLRSDRYRGNQPKLVKVVLSTSYQQKTVFSKVTSLCRIDGYKGVYIRPSMNPAERKLDYELTHSHTNGERITEAGQRFRKILENGTRMKRSAGKVFFELFSSQHLLRDTKRASNLQADARTMWVQARET
jgi:hypothetical protein